MPLLRPVFTVFLVVLFAIPSRAQDRHVISRSALEAAVAARVAQDRDDRAAIREALGQPEVRVVAARAGVDPARLEALAGTLSGSDLEAVASKAREVNDSLAGGGTVTISTTTIIIALLILILLVVALK